MERSDYFYFEVCEVGDLGVGKTFVYWGKEES